MDDERDQGEKCQACGRRYLTVYWVDDAIWHRLVDPIGAGLRCPSCLDAAAREAGITLEWSASVMVAP